MEHGGDLLSYESYFHGDLIDFSSNINPLGMPKGLKETLIDGLYSLKAYPDIKYRKLREAIGKYLGCSENSVLVGNGAVEIIDDFIIPSKRIITTIPSFSEYHNRGQVHKKEVISLDYGRDFSINLSSLEGSVRKGDLVILGNPNNPTGLRIEKDKLMDIYKLIIKRDAYLLLDEAFYEFCPPDYDSIKLFKPFGYKGIGVIRAATKFFALPGLRLGYGCAEPEKVSQLKQIGLPWSVNALADIAGQFIFKDKGYIEKSKDYINKERTYLLKALGRIKGIRVNPTHTNYILIESKIWDEKYLFSFFLQRGLVIRKCSSFIGLSDKYIRVAIKDRKNNQRLIEVFEELGKGN